MYLVDSIVCRKHFVDDLSKALLSTINLIYCVFIDIVHFHFLTRKDDLLLNFTLDNRCFPWKQQKLIQKLRFSVFRYPVTYLNTDDTRDLPTALTRNPRIYGTSRRTNSLQSISLTCENEQKKDVEKINLSHPTVS